MLALIVVLILCLTLFFLAPIHRYNTEWGYAPVTGAGLMLVVFLVLWLMGGVH